MFTVLRRRQAPAALGRQSRFYGSHLGPAWITLGGITAVVLTVLLTRATQINAQEVNETDRLQFLRGAFASQALAKIFEPLGVHANEVLETVFLLLGLLVLMVFVVFVTYSKHLHILASLPNVWLARRPRALGTVKGLYIDGKPVDLDSMDDLDEDAPLGVGKVEDFTWKGMLDFATCTECGRCPVSYTHLDVYKRQSQETSMSQVLVLAEATPTGVRKACLELLTMARSLGETAAVLVDDAQRAGLAQLAEYVAATSFRVARS